MKGKPPEKLNTKLENFERNLLDRETERERCIDRGIAIANLPKDESRNRVRVPYKYKRKKRKKSSPHSRRLGWR